MGGFGAAVLTEEGSLIARIPLPGRGHDITRNRSTGQFVVFARRPGTFAVAFTADKTTQPQMITSRPGRHFYGHGAFSADGRLLYASENDFDNAVGMVGVYDATSGYRRIGEFPSGGIGPHDILALDDGVTLAVANGGVETHPDFGRAKLNLATMQPSLCFIDRRDGTVRERHELPPTMHQLSIRHLADDGRGGIYFACQFEGSPRKQPQLSGHCRPGDGIRLFEMEPHHISALRNYIGSIAANPAAGTLAITSPRGNCMFVLNAETGAVLSRRNLPDICGISPLGQDYLASSGDGVLLTGSTNNVDNPGVRWDNHMMPISNPERF
nr:DUF1513 domain-containing protein [Hoeflea prorocentri]